MLLLLMMMLRCVAELNHLFIAATNKFVIKTCLTTWKSNEAIRSTHTQLLLNCDALALLVHFDSGLAIKAQM